MPVWSHARLALAFVVVGTVAGPAAAYHTDQLTNQHFVLSYEAESSTGQAFRYDGVVTLAFDVLKGRVFVHNAPAFGQPAYGAIFIPSATIDVGYLPSLPYYSGHGGPVPYHGTTSLQLEFFDRPATGFFSTYNFVGLDDGYNSDTSHFAFTTQIYSPPVAGGYYGGYVPSGVYQSDGTADGAYATLTVTTIGGVPEPATWGLMIAGFGLTGATLRRRRPVAA